MTAAVTPQTVVAQVLYAPATALVPRAGLSPTEITLLSQWTPSAVASQVPQAVVTAFTPQALAARLSPGAMAQTWVQDLATAAVFAALL